VLRYFEHDPDLTREERLLVSALLRTCPWCAALGHEAELIADANRAMIIPPAGRDFRLTPSQARRARALNLAAAGQRLRAVLSTDLVRPLAGVAVAAGLVLALVGAVPYVGNSGTNGQNSLQTIPVAADASSPVEAAGASSAFNAAESPFGPQVATQPQGGETPSAGSDTSGKTPPPPDASAMRITSANATPSPSEGPLAAFATVPGPTPEPGAAAAGAVSSQPGAAEAAGSEPLPPLLIFGVLLAIVGLLVLGLTVVARRMEHESG
jgi:hypothetical protein